MNLLIVDDEIWSRQLIKKILQWETYGFTNIYEAANGEEAIILLNQHNFELMITDMRMPGIDGAQLLQYVREQSIDTEVIVMSGYEDYKYLHEALKVKAIDYLLKPISKEDIIRVVKVGMDRILESRSFGFMEQVLLKDDVDSEITKYFEYKNMLFSSFIKSNEIDTIIYMDKIEKLYQAQKKNHNLENFLFSDLSRLVVKFEAEAKIDNEKSTLSSLTEIKTRIMNTFYINKDTRTHEKLNILNIQKYIDNHFSDMITLANLADVFYVSKEHLSRVFKQQVGVSVQQYIIGKKVDYAKKLLIRYQKLSIQGISVMAGFSELQYFYRVFKKRTSLTPVQFRKSNINIIQ